jgi:small-conductance mechanosensitive channel
MGVSPMLVDSIAKTKGIEGLRNKLKEKDVRDMSWTKGFTKEEQTLREVVRKMIDEELTSINETSNSQPLREGVEKDLADINKEAEHEVLQAKLDKIDALIDHRRSKLSKLDEDEDMKALTDKKKVKELEKDIKKLEVARKKIEKMMSKFKGKKAESKEVIDEDETPLEASEEYMQYKEDAERRYDEDESIDSILSNYNNISQDMKDMLRDDLEGKMDGMDF